MMKEKWWALTLLIAFASWNFAQADERGRNFVTVPQFKEDLSTRNIDLIVRSFNEIKRMNYQGEILPFIKDLWDGQRDKYSELPWDVIDSRVVRVEIADVLVQARRNELIEIDIEQIHDFAKQMAEASDVDVKTRAIGITGIIDDSKDIPFILDIGRTTKKSRVFNSVVGTLATMCSDDAKKALDELESTTVNERWKSELRDRRRRAETFFRQTGGAWCASR